MFVMRALAIFLAGLALAVPALAQTPTQSTESESQRLEGIAAIVNDSPISYSDVRERARLLLLSLGAQPTQQEITQITSQALQQLIDEKLQLQEAAEWEVGVSEAEIAGSIEDMAAQSGLTRDQLFQQLLASGINPTSLEEQMRAEIAWRRVMQGVYGSRIRISENQVNEELKQLRTSAEKTQYLLSEIFLYAPDPESQAQAMDAAFSIRAQIVQGAPFQVAAQRLSSAPTAATGGDMGWVSLEDIDQTVATVVSEMPGSGISDPIAVSDGIYLIATRAKREPQEAVIQVSLTRLLARDGSAEDLANAISEIETCEDIESIADESD
ncbi:MAG: SurA N-terminal domain-containing protein, partial [Hyphomonadaceae bacterium]|nr:SurA N-terminal domain-containing protein [Hyphomonadaceae bacterium]